MNIEIQIWVYWLFCTAAMLLLAFNRITRVEQLLSPEANQSVRKSQSYLSALSLGWLTTFLAAIGYIIFANKTVTGPYQFPDLILFSVLNGILEQFMFLFWLLVGCSLAKQWRPRRPKLAFISGYLTFFVFSGLIHAFFWKVVLPPHETNAIAIISILSVMSWFWMWLFWRYKAVLQIIAMHVCLDFVMISYLHSDWIEVVLSNFS